MDVAEVARRVAADLEAQAASRNIDVRVRANGMSAATQEVLARGDELLSYSMFANLVRARRARGRGARMAGHRLAGSFALYGFVWAAAQCRAIEHDAQDGEQRDLEGRVATVRAHLDRVTSDYAPAKDAISAGKA